MTRLLHPVTPQIRFRARTFYGMDLGVQSPLPLSLMREHFGKNTVVCMQLRGSECHGKVYCVDPDGGVSADAIRGLTHPKLLGNRPATPF